MIRTLYDKVDAFCHRLEAIHSAHLVCAPGCSACCRGVDLTVFPVEAANVRRAWKELDSSTREAVRKRAAAAEFCVFLVNDRCVIYDDRPLICRTQGLPMQLPDKTRDVCPLNFSDGPDVDSLAPAQLLDLDRLNTLLSAFQQADDAPKGASAIRRVRRTRISSVVR